MMFINDSWWFRGVRRWRGRDGREVILLLEVIFVNDDDKKLFLLMIIIDIIVFEKGKGN